MAAANAQQIKKIYAIGRALGIAESGNPDDMLHQLVESITGKNSIKALTYAEAGAVISDLQKRQGGEPSKKQQRRKVYKAVPGGATEGQQRKIWALMYDLQKLDTTPSSAALGDRLCAIIKKNFKVEATPRSPFAWMDHEKTNKLIEIIKKYIDCEIKKRR